MLTYLATTALYCCISITAASSNTWIFRRHLKRQKKIQYQRKINDRLGEKNEQIYVDIKDAFSVQHFTTIPAVFRIRIRIGSAFDWLPGSGSAFRMRIRIQKV
jgi:hypothetical protein